MCIVYTNSDHSSYPMKHSLSSDINARALSRVSSKQSSLFLSISESGSAECVVPGESVYLLAVRGGMRTILIHRLMDVEVLRTPVDIKKTNTWTIFR